jgi:hypothetical protein
MARTSSTDILAHSRKRAWRSEAKFLWGLAQALASRIDQKKKIKSIDLGQKWVLYRPYQALEIRGQKHLPESIWYIQRLKLDEKIIPTV